MSRKWLWGLVAAGALVLPAAPAAAQNWVIVLMPETGTHPEHIRSPMGTGFEVGGGVADFADSELRDLSGTGGTWNARAIFGTRSAIAGEVAYVGGAADIDALGLNTNAAIVRNGVEANLRLNLPIVSGPWMLAPYAFGGVGFTRFDLVNEGTNTSSVRSNDDVLNIPVGAGFAMTYGRFRLDGRYSYYPAFDDELLETPTGSVDRDASLDTWGVNLNLGIEI